MIGGVILAAGQSTRFGDANKLTTIWNGEPLVRHVVDAVLASKLDRVAVVTGHDREAVEAVLPLGCPTIHNYEYASGMAGSIRAGMYRLQGHMPVMVLLGDMPLVTASHIDALIEAFKNLGRDDAIVAATCDDEIGNPVLFGKSHFAALKLLEGDRGARARLKDHEVLCVEIGEAARRDFDTEAAFEVG